MKLFKKERRLYFVIAYYFRPKVGEIQQYMPLIKGVYKDIEKAKKCVNEMKRMCMYEYVTFVSVQTDL